MFTAKNSKSGFTLVELLVVIAIILILAAALLFAINPAELLRKSRDAQRVSDLNTLTTAINLLIADGKLLDSGENGKTYPSLISGPCATDGEIIAFGATTKACAASTSALTKNDGTGWVQADFTQVSSGAPVQALPVDPTNSKTGAAAGNAEAALYYRICYGTDRVSFVVDATLESTTNATKETNDGGQSDFRYEVGSDLSECGANGFTAD